VVPVRAVEESRARPNAFARSLFAGLPRRYDLLEDVLSFGQNRRWRTAMVDAVAAMDPPPRRVLDVATGTAGVALALCSRTGATVTGLDLTERMLAEGRRRVARAGRGDRVRLVCARAEQLPFDDGALDAVVTTSAFHFFDQPAALREFHRVLAPGGLAAVAALSTRQPLLQSPATNRWKPQHNASPAEMRALFEGAGFTVSDQHRIPRPIWTRIVSDLVTVGTKS
jgi:ubiquinone/menaquinone biosynthesis C-methylase UbiE